MPRELDDDMQDELGTRSDHRRNDDDAPRGASSRLEWLKQPICSAERFFWAALILAVMLSGYDLSRRLGIEWSHRVVAMVVEYRDLVSLSRQAGETPESVYAQMVERGARGITVAEFTGRDLASGVMPLEYGTFFSVPPPTRAGLDYPLDRASILVDLSERFMREIAEYLVEKIPSARRHKVMGQNPRREQILIVLPYSMDELVDYGLLPDFEALEFAGASGTASIFRPAPTMGADGARTAAAIAWLKRMYHSVSCILPSGTVVAGYPDLAPVAHTLRDSNIPVAQAEFVRQIGLSELLSLMNPRIIPLHSIARDELIGRRLSRDQVVERMVRAVHERSIRVLLTRPYEIYNTGRLPALLEDMGKIHDSLSQRGYSFGWPRAMPRFHASALASMGFTLVFLVCTLSFVRRYFEFGRPQVNRVECAAMLLATVLLGFMLWKISSVSRALGGFVTAMVAVEATIRSLDNYKRPFAGLIAGLLIVMAGGLCIAAGYGSTSAMLRLVPFSGVKLTLLLPPLLILANDLKKRVHPESFTEIIVRPPLWGELVLVGVLLAGAFLLTLRSDNVSFVPGWEVHFRDALERALWVRPRTKEFLAGYPCLIIYHALVRRGWAEHYREIFRVGASLAFASAINTFCHFHTLLPLTIVRVVNGWWLGIAVGFVALVIIVRVAGPIWRRGGRELFG
jgi:hypothetical protein